MISMISGKVKRKTILQVSRLVQLLVLLPQGLQLQLPWPLPPGKAEEWGEQMLQETSKEMKPDRQASQKY